jgi:hypothetical protein
MRRIWFLYLTGSYENGLRMRGRRLRSVGDYSVPGR